MEKTIIVVDEHGTQYESTYPKRANGLVKHGRARFLSESTICLACPPYIDVEELKMDFDTNDTQPQRFTNKETISVHELFEELKALRMEKDYIFSALSTIEKIPSSGGSGDSYSPGDVSGQAKAEAIQSIVCCREATTQKLLSLYEKMYDDAMLSNTN